MKKLKEYSIITIGIILVAIALEFFFFPNGIASGGISGLALIFNDLFGLSTGAVMIISNIILFIIAFIFVHIVEVRLSVLLLMVALRMIYWKKPMTRECALL